MNNKKISAKDIIRKEDIHPFCYEIIGKEIILAFSRVIYFYFWLIIKEEFNKGVKHEST